ncbi:MAG: hypothetical protein HC825_02340 [Oscillatoriales cyanobacterium RM1_1_9]|nr:hypothetical protein [Oscillatoriales cyanobacterium RM1_1_9]
MTSSNNPRQLAFLALQTIYRRGQFADIALDKHLNQMCLSPVDRRLATELVYGCVRRARSLDALIDQLAKKPANQQPPDLRIILHLGLYQLGYLTQIPAAAGVNTTVELARHSSLTGLTGLVNGILRQYLRQCSDQISPKAVPPEIVTSELVTSEPVTPKGHSPFFQGLDGLRIPPTN